jgi:hypothetical protein
MACQDLSLWITRETNSRTSSISRTGSKWCNPQNMSSMQLLLCSTFEYHTLLYQEVVRSLMTFLMKWCSYTSLLTLSPSWSCLECWVCILMWPSKILSKLYCFEIQGPLHLAWLVHRSLSKVWLCFQVCTFRHTSSVKELGLCQNSQDHIAFLVKQNSLLN